MATFDTTTPLIVSFTGRPCSSFKKHTFISMEDVSKSVFLSIPHKVLHNEDIRIYTHCQIEEQGSSQMLSLYNNKLFDGSLMVKLEFKDLEGKGFV